MKICLIGVFPDPSGLSKGGVANVMKVLADGLSQKGHEVHVISPNNSLKTIATNGYKIHHIKIPKFIPRVITNISIIRQRINNKIKQIEPDICHYHGTTTYSLNCKVSNIVTLHGINEKDAKLLPGVLSPLKAYFQSRLESYCRKRARNIIVINQYIIDTLGDFNGANTWHISNPISESFYHPAKPEKKQQAKVIFYCGMINQRKNILMLIKSFNELCKVNTEAELIIAGPATDKNYYEKCLEESKNAGNSNRIAFTGSINKDSVKSYLDNATCSILISHQETAPLFISESQACKTPVIASDVGGIRYMLDNGSCGTLVNKDNISSITDAMNKILSNDELRGKYIEKGFNYSQSENHPDKVISKTLSIYHEVIQKI